MPNSLKTLPILRSFDEANRYRNARPGVEDAPWGAWTLSVHDPFHNRLMFNERKPERGEISV